jgi:hypothetical protein
MSRAHIFPAISISTALDSLVVASFRNGSMTETERENVLEAVQQAHITTWDYLRAHLLIPAGIVPFDTAEEWQ